MRPVPKSAKAVSLVKSMPGDIGNGRPKRESITKLLFGSFEQRGANTLALKGWRYEKLVENALLREGREKTDNGSGDHSNLKIPSVREIAV